MIFFCKLKGVFDITYSSSTLFKSVMISLTRKFSSIPSLFDDSLFYVYRLFNANLLLLSYYYYYYYDYNYNNYRIINLTLVNEFFVS